MIIGNFTWIAIYNTTNTKNLDMDFQVENIN